jgi:hypothetical protein
MLNPKIRILTIACAVAAALLSFPAMSWADCYGCAAPVAVAAPACNTCVAPTYYANMPTYAYMPTPIYRTLYPPVTVAAYQPVVGGCNTCASYAYATYRPVFPWTYHGRLVPYTTYQPIYSAVPVAAYSPCGGCSPCGSCSPCGGYSPCGGCSTGTCGVATSGCSSCTAPATTVTSEPSANAIPQSPPTTFEKRVEKPVTEQDMKPIPQNDQNMKPMSAPALPDPRDRTTSRTVYTSARVALVSAPAQASAPADNDGWRPAKD